MGLMVIGDSRRRHRRAAGAAGYAVLRRSSCLDAKRRAKRAELRELLEASTSEAESRRLLIRHAQRVVPGAGAAMLTRNDTEKRLELTKADEAAPVLADLAMPESLEPRACLAVRLSRSYRQDAGTDPLIRCDACGAARGSTVCEPLLVAGTVIGTILVTREKRIDETEVAEVRNAVQLAAPILASQRNLALAEMRAATDTLTGLPNRRAAEEQLTRMVAHAGRSLGPLSALLLDLDHFKQVNDVHGHELGDQVLAIVAQTLRQSIRTSDFAARYGGEEFLILLPDTDTTGGQAVAEKLRTDIAAVDVPGLDRITASMGLAVVPDHALDVLQLLRQADRALYRAKEGGRNRVVVADRERASLPAA
jgi:diguanylate cyclase (GGDEF)-like protein